MIAKHFGQNFIDDPENDRLNCFGSFNLQDPVCFGQCALSVSCVITKNYYLNGHYPEETPPPELALGWNDLG
jgi:hypothetical protein